MRCLPVVRRNGGQFAKRWCLQSAGDICLRTLKTSSQPGGKTADQLGWPTLDLLYPFGEYRGGSRTCSVPIAQVGWRETLNYGLRANSFTFRI
jgi:hypothetical protein